MPRGFGDPDQTNVGPLPTGQVDFGWGFGDPEPGGWVPADPITWGFGDPDPESLLVVFFSGVSVLPDDGGEIATLVADWPRIGPYRVQLKDSFTDKTHPDPALQTYAYAPLDLSATASVIPRESPFDVKTEVKTTIVNGGRVNEPDARLSFVLPPLPPGLYDVVLAWGDNLEYSITVVRAIRVVHRGRSRYQWGLRASLPPNYTKGAAISQMEDDLTKWGA